MNSLCTVFGPRTSIFFDSPINLLLIGMTLSLLLDASDLVQYSHVNRAALAVYSFLLERYSIFMNEHPTWSNAGITWNYTSPAADKLLGKKFRLEVFENSPPCS